MLGICLELWGGSVCVCVEEVKKVALFARLDAFELPLT